MDRYRGGDRYGNSPNDSQHSRHPRGGGGGGGGPPPSRPSDDSLINRHRGGFSGNIHPFDNSPPRYSLTGGGGGGGGFHPMDGDGGFRPLGVRGGRNFNPSSEFEVPLSGPRFNPEYEVPLSGQKRRYDFPGRGGSSPDRFGGGGFEKRNFDGDNYDKRHVNGGNFDRKQFDGGNIAKLFVGSVPKTATEDDIRPPFEEYGNVLEVALIKDKRGQQQGNSVFASAGCCFIKYATSEEADRAIRALHNQYILPGGVGPIQVRYADGERERLGAVEYKLFIGSLNKQAIEKEVEEIFLPYGRVEDVYLMRDELKQSRGCGFVKYSNREAAMAAIDALNGIYRMRGCEQPLIVRFADPKRPRPGETRGSPGFGGPGFAPRLPSPGVRPPNQGEMMQAPFPQNAWHPMNQQQGMHGKQSSAPNFNPSFDKPNQSPQQFSSSNAPPSSTVRPPAPGQSQGQGQVQGQSQGQGQGQGQNQGQGQGQGQGQNQGQLQALNSGGQASFSQGFQSQPMLGYNGMLPIQQAQAQTQTQTQPQAQGVVSSTTQPALSNNMPPHVLNAMMNQYQLPGQQQQMMQQSASPMAQMLSQQKQTLQASYQSSQQAFSQLQQQLQLMQPTNPTTPQQNLQGPRLQQSTWAGSVQQTQATSGGPTAKPVTDSHPASSVASVMLPAGGLVKCNWTEHTSPDGYKYYYNSTTGESKWEKPEELTLFEQQQQQKPQEQQQPKQQQQQGGSIQPSHGQTNIQSLPSQQTQIPQIQLQSHLQTQMQPQGRHPQQLQPATQSSTYQNMQGYGYAQMPVAGGYMNDPARFPQGMQQQQGGQEWMWKNKATGPGS